jgi:hypothetical protein
MRSRLRAGADFLVITPRVTPPGAGHKGPRHDRPPTLPVPVEKQYSKTRLSRPKRRPEQRGSPSTPPISSGGPRAASEPREAQGHHDT